jgi:hypothetical protein
VVLVVIGLAEGGDLLAQGRPFMLGLICLVLGSVALARSLRRGV